MAGATEKKNAALAWAEKRKAQVEAANLKKAQKEMGEVTSDHTFKPKLRSGKASRSLVSVGSGKITPLEKPNLVSPVLKRRAGDVNLDTSTVEATAPVKVQERSTPQVRARKDLPSAGGKAPRELGEPREAAPKRPGGRAASPSSPALSPRTGAPRAAGTTVAAPARPDRARPAEAAPVEKTPVEKLPKAAAPPASEGLCWKAMTNGLRHWPTAAPAAAAARPVCFPDAPMVFSSNDLPADEEPQVTTLQVDPSGQKSVGSGKISSDFRSTEEDGLEAHLKLERLRQQLEEEQRQLEEEAAQLRQGKQVDAQRLQQLAEKQQQRLARFDKEHEQMEQSESAWVEDLASMPLPVITEQPELLEEFQSQHLEAFERLQKQWQLEQMALQEKLQDQLQMQHTPLQASEPQNETPAEDEAERKAAAVSKLAESLQVLQRQRQETELNERQEQQDLSERIKKFNMKVESLEARVKEPTSPSLFGVFQEFWTSEAFAGGADGDWFKSAATRLADLMASPEAQDAPDRTEPRLGEEDVPSAPQEKATSVTSTRRWPPGPLR